MQRIRKYRTGLLVILWLAACSFSQHELHLSVCTLDIENKQMSVNIKIFSDDLKLASGNDLPENYIKKHLQFIVNNKNTDYKIKKSDNVENSSIYVSKISVPDKISSVTVKNNLITEVFPDQTNLIIYTSSGSTNGFTLNFKETSCTFEL